MSKSTISQALAVTLSGADGPDETKDATIARLQRLVVRLSARLWDVPSWRVRAGGR